MPHQHTPAQPDSQTQQSISHCAASRAFPTLSSRENEMGSKLCAVGSARCIIQKCSARSEAHAPPPCLRVSKDSSNSSTATNGNRCLCWAPSSCVCGRLWACWVLRYQVLAQGECATRYRPPLCNMPTTESSVDWQSSSRCGPLLMGNVHTFRTALMPPRCSVPASSLRHRNSKVHPAMLD